MKNTGPRNGETVGADAGQDGADVDEYLWPLTGDTAQMDWSSLAEEIQLRQRLAEIAAHVSTMHVRPRLARWQVQPVGPALADAIRQGVMAGPVDGPPWEQTLKEPVPRALREEWAQLARRLRQLRFSCATDEATRR